MLQFWIVYLVNSNGNLTGQFLNKCKDKTVPYNLFSMEEKQMTNLQKSEKKEVTALNLQDGTVGVSTT